MTHLWLAVGIVATLASVLVTTIEPPQDDDAIATREAWEHGRANLRGGSRRNTDRRAKR